MKQAPDSSVCVAALIADHEAHDRAAAALRACEATIAHVLAETYSVLTRLPPPHRVEPAAAAAILEARLPGRRIALDAGAHGAALRRLADANVLGGATYDGLIALAAVEHELELISRDRRAARTYRALGARFRLLD